MDTILKLHHVTKKFAGITALKDVSFEVERGEVHALIGENGAGKSTLIKVVTGAITPEEGTIEFEGKTFSAMSPILSKNLGIQAIYQEFNLANSLTVAENLFMGNKIGTGLFRNSKLLNQKADEILSAFDVKISPKEEVRNLSVAYKQIVEIAKAIAKEAKFLIMDEPTAPLTEDEVDILFGIIDKLKQQGVTIIYISHRLDELFRVSDRVTVMRDGEIITTKKTDGLTKQELIRYMVGRELSETYPKRNSTVGDYVLEVDNISGEKVQPSSLKVRKGEVLGMAGLVGAGRTELVRLIFGADPRYSGEIKINGKTVNIRDPHDAVKHGVGYVAEDRKIQGVLLNMSIKWNITLPILHSLCNACFINKDKENACVNKYKESLRIKMDSVQNLVSSLSGGNQQKVALSKWLASESKVLIFDEPTRGIDVGAKQEIYQLINKLTEEGLAIIVISSEMEEILGLSDRLLIMHEGRIVKELKKEEFSQETVLHYASGEK